jgi:hypothetical protein
MTVIQFLRDFTALLPNWLSSLIAGLVVGTLVYLSTNMTWGWHDGIAFVAGYALNWWTTHAERSQSNNALNINWKQGPPDGEGSSDAGKN